MMGDIALMIFGACRLETVGGRSYHTLTNSYISGTLLGHSTDSFLQLICRSNYIHPFFYWHFSHMLYFVLKLLNFFYYCITIKPTILNFNPCFYLTKTFY